MFARRLDDSNRVVPSALAALVTFASRTRTTALTPGVKALSVEQLLQHLRA